MKPISSERYHLELFKVELSRHPHQFVSKSHSPLPINYKVVSLNCAIYSWVSLGYLAVNLSGGQPKMYWWLCCTGVKKSYKIAHICRQTQGQHIQWKTISLRWLHVHRFAVDSQWNYDVTWNPRIEPWLYLSNSLIIHEDNWKEIHV